MDFTEIANKYAKEHGYSEPDWLRKQCVEIFCDAAKVGYDKGYDEGHSDGIDSTLAVQRQNLDYI